MKKAILLTGGYSTRLYPLTLKRPKVLLPVAGKPVMQYLVEMLKDSGIKEITVGLNVKQKAIQKYFGNGEKYGVKIDYCFEESANDSNKLGGLGAINYVIEKKKIKEECLVVGGDNFVYGLDLKHMKHEHPASIALYNLKDKNLVEQFGIGIVDKNKRITAFQEKPKVEQAKSKLASTLIYRLSEEFVNQHLPEYIKEKHKKGEKADRPGDLWQHYVEKIPLHGLVFEGIWGDIGTAETYIETNKLAMELLIKNGSDEQVIKGKNVEIGENAVIRGPTIIEDNCKIGDNCIIGPYVHLMKGTEISKDSTVSGSILFENTKVGEASRIYDAIIDYNTSIEKNCKIDDLVIIGHDCVIGERTRVLSRSKIWPFIKIKANSIVEGELSLDLDKSELLET
ncbi:MAG: NDP-sugar synthase [Candidatus Micrarchaeota archaeon]